MINIIEILLKLFMLSVFTPLFYFPYVIAVLLWSYVVLKLIIIRKLSFYKGTKDLLILGLVFIIWAVISWAYNFFIGNVDFWSIFFWLITYSFPLWVIFFISLRNTNLDFEKMFHLYKKILVLEFCIGIVQALLFKEFAGDYIKGTCIDSHTLGLQYAIALIVLFIRILYSRKSNDAFYFFIFLIGIVMTGYTSNIVLLMLLFLLIFFSKTKFFIKISVRTFSKVFAVIVLSFVFLTVTNLLDYIVYGVDTWITNLKKGKETPLLWKVYSYELAFKEIPKEINIIFGLGPGSYTSRASQMRNPDVASRKLFIDIPSYKNKIFKKYIIENFYNIDYGLKTLSWGTLASPMTSITSTWVELGIIGMFLFMFFLWWLFEVINRKIKLSITTEDTEFFLRLKSVKFILLFFILDLFYLNYWEYPQMTIPVFVFYILGIKNVE
jgi:hypothetical protein